MHLIANAGLHWGHCNPACVHNYYTQYFIENMDRVCISFKETSTEQDMKSR